MKLFNFLVLTIGLISSAFAAKDYQITYYGCPKECDAQKKPSCHLPTYPLEHGGTKYFCALSTHFPHYREYCGKRVVVMLTDGSKNMINVQVVDSCSSCPKYHVDLSSYSFPALLKASKGEADCIWGVFDKSGKKLAGPIYKSVNSAAKKLGMSKESFVNAFVANASNLVKSGDHVGTFGKVNVTSKRTTTTHKQTTLKPWNVPGTGIPNYTRPIAKTLATKQTSSSTTTTTKAIVPSVPKTVLPKTEAKSAKPTPTTTTQVEDEVGEVEGVDATVSIAAFGGIVGAAGLGLLLMKKKNPSTYEGMKQKFPEAFNHIKRGVSRSATSIKRRVTTTKRPNETPIAPLASVGTM